MSTFVPTSSTERIFKCHSVDEAAERMAEVFDPSSRTFRSGQIDGWQSELDAASLAHLNDYCAPLCVAAGYEVRA